MISNLGIAIDDSGMKDAGLVYFDVITNGITYHWSSYILNDDLVGISIVDYLEAHESDFVADIEAKETLWAGMSHTRVDEFTGETVAIDKGTIVFPEMLSVRQKNITEAKQVEPRLAAIEDALLALLLGG